MISANGEQDPNFVRITDTTFAFHAPIVSENTTITDTLRLFDPVMRCWYDTVFTVVVLAPEGTVHYETICTGDSITLYADCPNGNSKFSENFDEINTGGDTWHSNSHTIDGHTYHGPGRKPIDSIPEYLSALSGFQTLSKVYPAGGKVKLGVDTAIGSMTSVPMNLTNPFSVLIRAKGWGSEPTSTSTPKKTKMNVVVDKGMDTQQERSFETDSAYHWPGTDAYRNYSLAFDGATDTSTITIETVAAGTNYHKRAFVDYVKTNGNGCSFQWSNGSTDTAITVSPSETTTYYVTVTPPEGGCVRVDTFVVTVKPLPEVEITVPSDICPNAGTVEISASLTTQTTPNYTYTWNSNDITLSSSTTNTVTATIPSAPESCGHSYTISVSVTDGNECVGTTTSTISVQNPATPVITASTEETVNLGCNPTAEQLAAPTFTVNDPCNSNAEAVVTTETPEPTTTDGCNYTQTWYANYSGDCANAQQMEVTYTWKNATPTIAVATNNNPDGACATSITPPTFTVTDPCNSNATAVVTTETTEPTTTDGCNYTQTWYANYSGDCANAQQMEVTYTWTEDNNPPAITLADGSQPDGHDWGYNPTIVIAPDFIYTDNCGGNESLPLPADSVTTNGPVNTDHSYSQTWIAHFTDPCGNSADPVSITYTWTESSDAPVITLDNDSQENGHDWGCNPTVVAPAFTFSDNCQGLENQILPADSVTDIGIINTSGCGRKRTWTAHYTDPCGNHATPVSVSYTWTEDNNPPAISLADGSQPDGHDWGCSAPTAPAFSVSDNCEGDFGLPADSISSDGVMENGCSMTQTWTAHFTDPCGNSATPLSVTYTWTEDNNPPAISLADGSQPDGHDWGCFAPTAPAFSVSDNCEGMENQILPADSVIDSGVTNTSDCGRKRTWTAYYTDPCGNKATPLSITYTWSMPSIGTDTITVYNSLEFNDSIYTESTIIEYTSVNNNACGCDSIITLHLVVNHNDSLAESRTVCENDLPMIWHGVEFNEAGDTTVTIPATSGADTVMTLHLLVTPLDTVQLFDTLCAGETFDSLNFNIVATNDTILALTVTSPVTNCDSTTLLHLSVLQPSDSTVIIDTCDSFVWHGITYYESTIATFDTINAAGCDSIATLNLTIRHSINPFLYDTINENDLPYVLQPYGWEFDTAGTYYLFTLDTLGCNSMITLVLTVNMNQFVEVYDTVCEGDLPMPWNSLTISEAGDFMDTLLATTTADSIVTLHLTVNQPSYYTDTVNTCDSFTWIDGITYTESTDTATYILTNSAGCDSVMTLHLTLLHSTTSVDTLTACDSLVWHGETYYASNTTATFDTINEVNCDSTVTLNLTIYNSTHNPVSLSTCDSLEWHGVYYANPGTYLYEYANDHNCPSTDTLHLSILQPTQFEDFVNACDSAIWHDSTYYTSTIDTFITTNAAGCDSLIILHLSLGVPTGTDTTVTACGSFTWHGATYTETCISTYTHLQLDDHGCERVDTLRLTILPTSETLETYTECDSLVWHSRTYYESTIDTIFETNEGGCDSLVILHLTILHPAHAAVTESACDSYSWNGQVYTESGDYTYPHLDANSCTQVDTLHLTIGHPSNSIVTDTACNSYTWHGTTYTSSTTTATFDTINAAGCDSTATLHLTILHSTESVDSRTVCDSLVWHGNTYYQSTTATFDTINAAGCDSTVTLQLTINHSNTSEQTLTECDSIVFDGTTYYESTTLTINTDNAAGCDSIATVHLIVNHPEPVTTTKEVCDDYFWNGQYYNQTGIYTFQHLDANGCTQVDTLNLTFLDATTNIISLTNDFCETKNAVLQVETNLADYVWNTGETSTQITVFDDGIYTVTASQGECSIEATYTIAPCEYDILLPNAFTPNGDANNEFFSIPETHLEKINDFGFSIYIYNRYGVVVFHSTDKHFLWDGKVNGQVFHNNIYNYVIQYRTTSGVPKRLSGSVITL
ncbi:MAG: gliding motility-associated C-terminal domain-containing protein [Bacteroidales bacterium]|nr:gliding motility-associated C-terminal domain-containing protein [Bacteroidales bacterium]